MYKSVYLKKGKEESLKRFHPWIFSGAIQTMDEGIEEGDIVRVFTRSGEFIAIGHYQIGSIAVRVLSFRDIEIDEEYWCARLDSAYKMRLALGIAGNSSILLIAWSMVRAITCRDLLSTAMVLLLSCRLTVWVCMFAAWR